MDNVVKLKEFKKKLLEKKEEKEEAREEEVRTLSDEQINRILYSVIAGREEMPTEEEMISVIKWAHNVTVRANVLNMMYQGELFVEWDEEEETLRLWSSEERIK